MRALSTTALAALLLPFALSADNLSSNQCTTDTLTNYEANGTCANGILNYSNFSFQATALSGTPTLLTADDIQVSPSAQSPGYGDLGNTGFTISPETGFAFSVDQGDSVQYVIDWMFVIDNGPYAGSADLGMDPGNASITQDYCTDSYIAVNPTNAGLVCNNSDGRPVGVPQTLSVNDSDPSGGSENAHITFNPTVRNFATVETIILLDGTNGPDHFDSLTANTEIDPSAPEPATVLLAPAGLVLFGLIRKRLANREA